MTGLRETDISRLFTEHGAVLLWGGEEFRTVNDIVRALKGDDNPPEELPGEVWLPVEGFVGRYSISDCGRVRRDAPAKGTRRGKILKAYTTKSGYKQVRLTPQEGGRSASYFVHRLLALTFIPNPQDHPHVRHLNDEPWDNRLENLARGTQSENMFDAVLNGKQVWASRETCSKGHPLSGDNLLRRVDRPRARICVICDKSRKRDWYEKNKEKSHGN